MSPTDIDELGPVDHLVVEFPPETSRFTGEMARELLNLVGRDTIRVLDLLILRNDEDGAVEAFEIDDIDGADPLRALETEIAELLAEEDVVNLATAMENGSTAAVLVWENSWAAQFASAVRRSGGQLIANDRIPIQAILASMEAEDASTTEPETIEGLCSCQFEEHVHDDELSSAGRWLAPQPPPQWRSTA